MLNELKNTKFFFTWTLLKRIGIKTTWKKPSAKNKC